MYSDIITLFNFYESDLGNMWFPHILVNVNLIADKASIVAKYGAESTDNASLHIKYENEGDKTLIQGIEYLPPKEWRKQPNDELSEYITFDSKHDFIILGKYENDQPILDDDYESGFYDYMSDREDYCYAITSVGKYKVIPHFEIMCK